MWQDITNFIITYLDPVGVVIGFIVVLPVFGSWIMLLGQRRRQQVIIDNIKQTTGERPVALVINVGPGDVSNQVRAHLSDKNLEMELERFHLSVLTQDTVADFVQALRKIRAKLMERGTGKIHLFYFGPVSGALLVGDVFSNGAVSIYYYDRDKGSYECWGPLTYPMIY